MQVTELKRENLELHTRISIPSDVVVAEVTDKLTDLARKAKVPGFRAGKVPLSIMRQKYGISVKQDVVNRISANVGRISKDMSDKPLSINYPAPKESEPGIEASTSVIEATEATEVSEPMEASDSGIERSPF